MDWKEKWSLQHQLEKVKKNKKEEFYATKKSSSKDTSSSQDLYPRNTIVIAGDSILNGVFEDRLHRKSHVVKVRNFPCTNAENVRQGDFGLIAEFKKIC